MVKEQAFTDQEDVQLTVVVGGKQAFKYVSSLNVSRLDICISTGVLSSKCGVLGIWQYWEKKYSLGSRRA